MKTLILSLLLLGITLNTSFATDQLTYADIPTHDATAGITQRITDINALLNFFVDTRYIEFAVPTTSSEIRIYNSKGALVGHNNFYLQNGANSLMPIVVDAITMEEGEDMTLKFWNAVDQTEKELEVSAWNTARSYSLYPLSLKYYYASDLVAEKVIFKTATNVPLKSSFTDFEINPNPASEVITIKVPNFESKQALQVTIVGVNGNLIKTQFYTETAAQAITINVSDVPNGVYIIQVYTNAMVLNHKVVVQH